MNSKTFSATIIVLKSHDLGEADKILSLFSREYGLIRAVAKGVKKAKSKFGGNLQLLNVNHLEIRKGRNLGTITQCSGLKVFPELRQDYDKLVYSLFMGELVLIFSNEEEPAEKVFDLLVYSLELMQHIEQPLVLVIWFEMQLLKLLGYRSNLTTCDICHTEVPDNGNEKLGFSLLSGSLLCRQCLKNTAGYHLINDQFRNTLRQLKNARLNDLGGLNPEQQVLANIQNILKEYLSHLSERNIKTLSIL